jgi:hypothetical protein
MKLALLQAALAGGALIVAVSTAALWVVFPLFVAVAALEVGLRR